MANTQAVGKIVQCIGAVVDVEFPRGHLPKVYDALTMEGAQLTLEVQQQLGDGIVRTIALGSSDGLRRGMKVTNTGAPISVPVGPATLGRIMDVLGRLYPAFGSLTAGHADAQRGRAREDVEAVELTLQHLGQGVLDQLHVFGRQVSHAFGGLLALQCNGDILRDAYCPECSVLGMKA